jgi:hypothetical protein
MDITKTSIEKKRRILIQIMNLKKIYDFKNIVVVGVSKNEEKAALLTCPTIPLIMVIMLFRWTLRLQNPREKILWLCWGKRGSRDCGCPLEIRRIAKVIGDAIKKKGIKVIWMQLAVYNEGALKKAREYGFDVVSTIDAWWKSITGCSINNCRNWIIYVSIKMSRVIHYYLDIQYDISVTYSISGSVESLPSWYHQKRVYESRFSRMISFYELNLLSNSLVFLLPSSGISRVMTS